MPPQFDPSWEYYLPDPEVEEILQQSSSRLSLLDKLRVQRKDKSWTAEGFRFGQRECQLNSFEGVLGKPPKEKPRTLNPLRVCLGCDKYFRPGAQNKMHCSRECYTPVGRPRGMPDKECPQCKKQFRPKRQCQRFCDPVCFHKDYKLRRNHVLDPDFVSVRCQAATGSATAAGT